MVCKIRPRKIHAKVQAISTMDAQQRRVGSYRVKNWLRSIRDWLCVYSNLGGGQTRQNHHYTMHTSKHVKLVGIILRVPSIVHRVIALPEPRQLHHIVTTHRETKEM